jgi:hypothetical protein
MGHGEYDLQAHRAATRARAAMPSAEVFQSNGCHPEMNPRGVHMRESRDSEAHPDSVGVVFALDVSGSMGEIPQALATETMPLFMESALTVLPDPQVMFMAFGNAYADRSPLQVGQFESEAALIDRWLAATHLEGGGGGLGESYDLAMYFAARHTAMDCFEKRQRKGYLFMTGDEVPFTHVSATQVNALLGEMPNGDIAIHEIATEVTESFHPFFLIPDAARAEAFECAATWRLLWHERVIVLSEPGDTAVACALLIGIQERQLVTAADITRQLEERLHRTGEARDRVLRAVLPFAEALARGPIAAPQPLSARGPTNFQG